MHLHNNQRTKPELERKVVELIALGTRYTDISSETSVPVSTIKKIKRRNKNGIIQIQQELLHKQAQNAQRLHRKSLQLINRFLDEAESGKRTASILELVAVTKEMHRQSMLDTEPSHVAESPERLRTLLAAIQSDDTTILKSLVFSEN